MRRRMDRLMPLMTLPFLMQATLASAASCEETLKEIQQYYNNTVDQCVGANGEPNPASDCSGLIARGTSRPEDSGGKAGDWYPWNDSPGAQARGATAATYLRKDIGFKDVTVFKDKWNALNNGYFVKAIDKTGPDEPKAHVLCAGPADLWADERDNNGCGDNQKTEEIEKSCQDMGVDGKTWVNNYFIPHMIENTELIGGKSCAFSLQGGTNAERTDGFRSFLEARRAMQDVPNQDTSFSSYTEVRIPAAAENTRPIWAFFYTDDAGRSDALKDQQEYKQVTGKDVPVIKMTYPSDKNGVATFSCDVAQAPPPTPATPDGLDAIDKMKGGWGVGDDPKKCSSYVQSAVWINRENWYTKQREDSLSITMTDCGREIGQDQTDAAWAEAAAKGKAQPGGVAKWNDKDDTLRRQFVCHLVLEEKDANGNVLPVRYKQEYNLELRRPYVDHEQSIRDDCNPEVADPVSGGGGNTPGQCPDYIKSVKWVPRKDFGEYPNQTIQSLEVIYNDCALNFGEDKTAAVMAEMKRKALAADSKGAEYWGKKDESMRRQAICLVQKFPGKNPVYLESIRPNGTSQEDVNKQNCNHK